MNRTEQRQFTILVSALGLALALPAMAAFWFAKQVIEAEPDALRLRLHEFHKELLNDLAEEATAVVDEELESVALDFYKVDHFGELSGFAQRHPVEAIIKRDESGSALFPSKPEPTPNASSTEASALRAIIRSGEITRIEGYLASIEDLSKHEGIIDVNGRDILLDSLRWLAEGERGVWLDAFSEYLLSRRIEVLSASQFVHSARLLTDAEVSEVIELTKNSLDALDYLNALDRSELLKARGWLRREHAGGVVLFVSETAVARLLQTWLQDQTGPADVRIVLQYLEEEAGQSFAYSRELEDVLSGWVIGLDVSDTATGVAPGKRWVYIAVVLCVIVFSILIAVFIAQRLYQQYRLNQQKNTFVATVSHELKTPLAASRLLLDSLESSKLTEAEVSEYIGLLSAENERLATLVDQFLTFSKMERNEFKADEGATRLADLIKSIEAWARLHPELSGDAFLLQCECAEASLAVDLAALQTALINLLNNAVKYSEAPREICLNIHPCEDLIEFKVSDNGCGISATDQAKIFERFYQVDTRLSRKHEGVGLGLSIVQAIVKAYHGDIKLESQLGEGSRFILRFPKIPHSI